MDLKRVLLDMPPSLGNSMFSGAQKDIMIFGYAQPRDYVYSAYDRAYNHIKEEVVALKHEIKSLKAHGQDQQNVNQFT